MAGPSCFICLPYRILCIGFLCLSNLIGAQTIDYEGRRVAVFDFKVLQVRGKTVKIKCRLANTGRFPTGGKKDRQALQIELDTANIPALLWGFEADVSEAAGNLADQIALQPGEISEPVWLDIRVTPPPAAAPGTCPDLVLDTAFIEKYTDTQLEVCAILKNVGDAPAIIEGENPLGMHLYFVAGLKLTRGALPAGETWVVKGRESLTGTLAPGQKLKWVVSADLKKRSKFAPNLVLELAPPPGMSECNLTNNTRVIEIGYP